MMLNDAQSKFISELQTMLPLYQGSADPRLKTPATNLGWNVKKLSGQGGETIDGPTFAQRTQADLELIAASLASGAAGQAFAARGAGEVSGIFGASGTVAASPGSSAPAATSGGEASPTTSATAVDVTALLSQKADESGEKLAWKTSVVDLLKLLGKDSSQAARHRYAVAVGFPEEQIGQMPSSEFNTWLHGQLLSTLAHNGGSLPANIA
jgi:hypothetical protein